MNPLAYDLDHVLAHTSADVWEALRGRRIFITGGTGFYGCWMLEAFVFANDKLNLGAEAYVLTRNAGAFTQKAPHLARNPSIHLRSGDVGSFDFPAGEFSHVIHGAIDYADPAHLFEDAMEAMQRVLDFSIQAGAGRFLFASSGAVYGVQPPMLAHLDEDSAQQPAVGGSSAYAEAKRAGEQMCASYGEAHGLQAVIARGFAFVGPYLALHLGSAIGNFIGDALANRPIEIRGDGTPLRSYLYGADLAAWLWIMLLRGEGGRAYNVGSDAAISVGEVARLVAEVVNPRVPVRIALKPAEGKLPARYVPSIERARRELGLQPWTDLREGIKSTANWHRAQNT